MAAVDVARPRARIGAERRTAHHVRGHDAASTSGRRSNASIAARAAAKLVNAAPFAMQRHDRRGPAANWISAIAAKARRAPSHTNGVSG